MLNYHRRHVTYSKQVPSPVTCLASWLILRTSPGMKGAIARRGSNFSVSRLRSSCFSATSSYRPTEEENVQRGKKELQLVIILSTTKAALCAGDNVSNDDTSYGEDKKEFLPYQRRKKANILSYSCALAPTFRPFTGFARISSRRIGHVFMAQTQKNAN